MQAESGYAGQAQHITSIVPERIGGESGPGILSNWSHQSGQSTMKEWDACEDVNKNNSLLEAHPLYQRHAAGWMDWISQ